MSQIQATSPDESAGGFPMRLPGVPGQGSPPPPDGNALRLRGSFEIRPTLVGRAKAAGLAVLYVAAFILLLLALLYGLAAAGLSPVIRPPHPTLPAKLLREWEFTAAAVLALVLLAVVTREPGSRLGFAPKAAWRDVPLGLAAGFLLMAGPLAVIWAMGGCEFSGLALPSGRILSFAALYALFESAVAVLEETLFRSFILVQLSRAVSFWPAAVVTAVLFGLAHGGNVNEAPVGLLVVVLGGVILAYSFWRSGALWFAIGWHAAYDYTEDFIFGVPDSGNVPQDALLNTTLHGPTWLTGGLVGPEASVLVLPAFLVLLLVVRLALPRRAV